jgi:DNA invertase Pin-like site-specific DNA recombinase
MKIVGYARTTGAEERSGVVRSVDEQELILRAFAREAGHQLVAVHRDTGLGDGDRSTRAGLMSLLDSMDEGWESVLVVTLDRLATRDVTLDVLEELRENEKSWTVLGEPTASLCLAAAKRRPAPAPVARPTRAQSHPAVAGVEPLAKAEPRDPEQERKHLADRLLKGREAGARAGKHQSGPAPYGYRRDYGARSADGVLLKLDQEECDVVRFIFREYLRVRSMKRLIELLEEKKCKTRRGKQWSRAGVSWILKNDTYVGRVHFGDIRARGRHEPIVSPIIFNKVQKLIRLNDKRKKHSDAAVPVAEAVPVVQAPIAELVGQRNP